MIKLTKLTHLVTLLAALACAPLSLLADMSAAAKAGQKVTITITGVPKAIRSTTYMWFKNGVKIKPTSPWLVFNHVAISDSGTYTVVISDERGVVGSDKATIVINH